MKRSAHLKFYDQEGITTFYSYWPSRPSKIPLTTDYTQPTGGEIFIPDNDTQVDKARAFAEEKYGYTIERDGNYWWFAKYPKVPYILFVDDCPNGQMLLQCNICGHQFETWPGWRNICPKCKIRLYYPPGVDW